MNKKTKQFITSPYASFFKRGGSFEIPQGFKKACNERIRDTAPAKTGKGK